MKNRTMGSRALRKERRFIEEAQMEQRLETRKREQSQQKTFFEKKDSKNDMPFFDHIENQSDEF
jgi:hypothetical protein|eukprot:scaffold4104_cov218-Chaetoceros_neogracile.AAC.3